jgi:hypothetical protein
MATVVARETVSSSAERKQRGNNGGTGQKQGLDAVRRRVLAGGRMPTLQQVYDLAGLTAPESIVVRAVAEGSSFGEAAAQLGISSRQGAHYHFQTAARKLGKDAKELFVQLQGRAAEHQGRAGVCYEEAMAQLRAQGAAAAADTTLVWPKPKNTVERLQDRLERLTTELLKGSEHGDLADERFAQLSAEAERIADQIARAQAAACGLR